MIKMYRDMTDNEINACIELSEHNKLCVIKMNHATRTRNGEYSPMDAELIAGRTMEAKQESYDKAQAAKGNN